MQPHVWLTHIGLPVNLGGEILKGEIELNIVACCAFKCFCSSVFALAVRAVGCFGDHASVVGVTCLIKSYQGCLQHSLPAFCSTDIC